MFAKRGPELSGTWRFFTNDKTEHFLICESEIPYLRKVPFFGQKIDFGLNIGTVAFFNVLTTVPKNSLF